MTSHIVASERDADLIALVLKAQVQQGKLSVEVKPYVENRRRRQEDCYRGWLRIVAKETGNEADVLHIWFKRKFLGVENKVARFSWQGKTVERELEEVRSTTSLNIKEMGEFLTQIETFVATNLGIKLPRDDS